MHRSHFINPRGRAGGHWAASKLIPAIFALLAASASHALGFGDLILHSALNQPLDARVDLLAVKPSERASVEVRLADTEAFERFGVSRSPALDEVRIEVIPVRDSDRIRVQLTTERPVREPFLTFLLEADWDGGRSLREYTVLLDPPVETPAARAPAQQEQEQEEAPPRDRRAPAPAERAPAPASEPASPPARTETAAPRRSTPAAATADVGRYGPIARNETLWGIARELRPDSRVSMNQMQLAIYRANPQAFNGNINRLMAGATLVIPDAGEVRAIDQATAREEIIEQQREYENYRRGARSPARAARDRDGSSAAADTAAEDRALRLEPPSDDSSASEEAAPEERIALTAAPDASEDVADEIPDDNPVATAQALAERGRAASENEADEESSADDAPAAAVDSGDGGPGEIRDPREPSTVAGAGGEDTPADTVRDEKPAAKAVVPEGSTLPLSARNILLTLAVLLLAAVAFVWMRRRQYKPIPDDFSARGSAPRTAPAAGAREGASEATPEERAEAVAEILTDADGYVKLELYDEALSALEVGLEKYPQEAALQHKVLEVHYAAGSREDFIEAAARYFPEPNDTDPAWWAVAAMGRDLAPDEERFSDVPPPESRDGAPESELSAEADEADASADAGDEEKEGDTEVTESADEPEERPDSKFDLDFDLDDDSTGEDEAKGAREAETEAIPPSLDVDLSQFQVGDKPDERPEAEETEEAEEPEAAGETEADDEDEFRDLELDSLSLEETEESEKPEKPEEAGETPAVEAPDEAGEGLTLTEETPEESDDAAPASDAGEKSADTGESTEAESDEVTTNLDLARAYLDMGEPDMARSLLNEVKDQGNAEQRREAEELLERASG